MSKFVLLNTRPFAGAADLTGQSNKIELVPEVEDKDVTTFASGGHKELIGGLKSVGLSAEGFWEAGDPGKVDDRMWADLAANAPWTICPDTANVGDLAWLSQGLLTKYQLGANVGDVAPWSASARGNSPLARGQILQPPGTARTSTGIGTARQLGAVVAGKRMYVNLHVLSVTGTTPSMTMIVESDDSGAFASPTTRATFTAATTLTSQSMSVAGAITDDWWRVRWTISGTTPSFLFVASAGIA